MESNFLTSILLPLCLITIMFGMGMSLVLSDFTRVFSKLKPTLTGLFCQIILLPFIAFSLAVSFELSHNLAVGLMTLSLVPGAVTSNFFTYLARGNVALSISLTAIVSLIAPITLPFFLTLAMRYFSHNQEHLNLPLTQITISLFAITIAPVSAGMFARRTFEDFAKKCEGPLRKFSTTVLFLIVLGLIKKNWAIVPESFGSIGLVCLLFNLTALSSAYMISSFAGLSKRDATTIAIEAGFQSSVTALFITGTLLGQGEMAIVPAVYSLVMFFTGSAFIWVLSKWGHSSHNSLQTLSKGDKVTSC